MSIHWWLAALAAGVLANAQEVREIRISAQPCTPAALRVDTNLVEVRVVVRSHDGRAISGLKREDFELSDQGQPRELTYFAVETPEALTIAAVGRQAPATPPKPASAPTQHRFIALYFEDFGTNTGDLRHAQVAGRRFVQEGLDDGDRVAVFSTSGDFLDYTTDKTKLTAAIDKLRSHPKFSEAGLGGCPQISPYQAYQISVMSDPAAIEAAEREANVCSSSGDDTAYGSVSAKGAEQAILAQAQITWSQVRTTSQMTLDAISRALRSLETQPGPRLFLLVASGFNSGTLELERDHLINRALRAGIVISSVDAKGLYTAVPGRGPNEQISIVGGLPAQTFRFETGSVGSQAFANNQLMSDLAQATGGLFFHNNNDLPYGFRLLGALPEVSYVLGFRAPDPAANEKYHKLKVTLTGSNPYVVQARPGYFAAPPAPATGQDLDREVTAVSSRQDFAASVSFRLDPAPKAGMVTVKTQIHVAIDKLTFPIRDHRRVQQLKLVVALLDPAGNIVAAKEGTMDFAMSEATYAHLSATGINAGLNLDVPPGDYHLRAVVQESVSKKMASTTLPVEMLFPRSR